VGKKHTDSKVWKTRKEKPALAISGRPKYSWPRREKGETPSEYFSQRREEGKKPRLISERKKTKKTDYVLPWAQGGKKNLKEIWKSVSQKEQSFRGGEKRNTDTKRFGEKKKRGGNRTTLFDQGKRKSQTLPLSTARGKKILCFEGRGTRKGGKREKTIPTGAGNISRNVLLFSGGKQEPEREGTCRPTFRQEGKRNHGRTPHSGKAEGGEIVKATKKPPNPDVGCRLRRTGGRNRHAFAVEKGKRKKERRSARSHSLSGRRENEHAEL